MEEVQAVRQVPKKKAKSKKRNVHIDMGVFYLQKIHLKTLGKESLTMARYSFCILWKNKQKWKAVDICRFRKICHKI